MPSFTLRHLSFVPLLAMGVLALAGLLVPGYSTLSQHMSELGLLHGWPRWVERSAAVISGAAILVFSLALLAHGSRFACSALTSLLFAACMISNGVFTMGNPLHGLYGIGMFSVLTPLLFISEYGPAGSAWLRVASRAVSLIGVLYLWMMVCGFDPAAYRGLTQRLAALPAFAWYALAAIELRRAHGADDRHDG